MTTATLLPGNWCRLNAAAISDSRVSATALRVLAVLSAKADHAGKCWPSINTIAVTIGVTYRHAQRCLRQLEDLGYVRRLAHDRPQGGQTSNTYLVTLTLPPIKQRANAPTTSASSGGSVTQADSRATTTRHTRHKCRGPHDVQVAPLTRPSLSRAEDAGEHFVSSPASSAGVYARDALATQPQPATLSPVVAEEAHQDERSRPSAGPPARDQFCGLEGHEREWAVRLEQAKAARDRVAITRIHEEWCAWLDTTQQRVVPQRQPVV